MCLVGVAHVLYDYATYTQADTHTHTYTHNPCKQTFTRKENAW